jgi:DNA polymerase III epsilon subunit-like protein
MARPDVYISVDVEADGPVPGPYSMLSVGAAVAGWFDGTSFVAADPARQVFYRELRPVGTEVDPEALAVSGLDRDRLLREGADPAEAMAEFVAWVREVADAHRPVVVAYPAVFDWMFLYWYLVRFTGASPFGHSGCLDVKTMYAVKARVPFGQAVKGAMPARLRPTRQHTHHALDDAVEQAELFANVFRWEGGGRTLSADEEWIGDPGGDPADG